MDKILLTEFLPEIGHSNLFDHTLMLLICNYEVRSMKAKRRDNTDETIEIYYYERKFNNRYLSRLDYIIYSISNIRKVLKVAKKERINNIICVTYDEYALFLYSCFISSRYKIFIMHHNNIDKYESHFFSRILFRLNKKRFHHIVQCGFMADYLEDKYNLKNVIVWPHPMNPVKIGKLDKSIDCLGISNSNDEGLIKFLIDVEDKYHYLMNGNLKVVIRSKTQSYNNGYLIVINGMLEKETFDDYVQRAKSILIPFPEDYKIRMSGTLIDALTNNIIVYATSFPLIEESRKEYPDIIKIFDKNNFYQMLAKLEYNNNTIDQFNKFRSFHSDENLSNIMFTTLNEGIKGECIHNIFDF